MKKPLFLRIIGLVAIYGAVFTGLVIIQFPQRGETDQRPRWSLVSFRAWKPAEKVFSLEEYTLPAALAKETFNEALLYWRDQSLILWAGAPQPDEDMVITAGSEALRRGLYKTVMAALVPPFLNNGQRTYESSVYAGRLEEALRSQIRLDGEKNTRLTRLMNERSANFLLESHGLEYFALSGSNNMLDQGEALARSLDLAVLGMELIPGIFEGYLDWKQFRPQRENPFDRLIEGTLDMVSKGLRKDTEDTGGILFFQDDSAESNFNLRLGKALTDWAESAGNTVWAAVGRSITLTVLSLQDTAGTVPGSIFLSPEKTFAENTEVPRISSAGLYRILNPGTYYPHAVRVSSQRNSLWFWTASPSVSITEQGEDLDLTVNFPAGETHYLLIRGVQPFVKIQLHGVDYHSDPQFERYDSSGWAYSAAERTLMLKLRHRANTELIKIVYTRPPAPTPPPAAEPEGGASPGDGMAPGFTPDNAAAFP